MRQLDGLKEEFQVHSKENFSSYQELTNDIFKTLKPYFRNTKNLKKVISIDAVFNEYNTIKLFIKEDIDIEVILLGLLNIYYKADNTDQKILFKLFTSDYSDDISSAIQNYAQLSLVEIDKDEKRLDLFTKICFREIGDILEGSLFPFLKLMYASINITNDLSKNIKLSFGSVVKNLEAHSILNTFVVYSPHNVSINQIRNIAYHNSYELVDDKIICTYGNNKVLNLERSDLKNIYRQTTTTYMLLKFAHTFFFMDNIDALQGKRINLKITNDSLTISVSEISYMYGFNIVNIDFENNLCKIVLEEFKRFSGFEENINIMIDKIFVVLNCNIDFTIIPIFDKQKLKFKLRI